MKRPTAYNGFNGWEEGPDFGRVTNQLDQPFHYVDIDLGIARKNAILDIAGDFLYIDQVSAGIATIELNNEIDVPVAPLTITKGFIINAPFKKIKFSNASQVGTMRLIYSTGHDIRPTPTGDVSVTNVITAQRVPFGPDWNLLNNAAISGGPAFGPVAAFTLMNGAPFNGYELLEAGFTAEMSALTTGNYGQVGLSIANNSSTRTQKFIVGPSSIQAVGTTRIVSGKLSAPIKITNGQYVNFETAAAVDYYFAWASFRIL